MDLRLFDLAIVCGHPKTDALVIKLIRDFNLENLKEYTQDSFNGAEELNKTEKRTVIINKIMHSPNFFNNVDVNRFLMNSRHLSATVILVVSTIKIVPLNIRYHADKIMISLNTELKSGPAPIPYDMVDLHRFEFYE